MKYHIIVNGEKNLSFFIQVQTALYMYEKTFMDKRKVGYDHGMAIVNSSNQTALYLWHNNQTIFCKDITK